MRLGGGEGAGGVSETSNGSRRGTEGADALEVFSIGKAKAFPIGTSLLAGLFTAHLQRSSVSCAARLPGSRCIYQCDPPGGPLPAVASPPESREKNRWT